MGINRLALSTFAQDANSCTPILERLLLKIVLNSSKQAQCEIQNWHMKIHFQRQDERSNQPAHWPQMKTQAFSTTLKKHISQWILNKTNESFLTKTYKINTVSEAKTAWMKTCFCSFIETLLCESHSSILHNIAMFDGYNRAVLNEKLHLWKHPLYTSLFQVNWHALKSAFSTLLNNKLGSCGRIMT